MEFTETGRKLVIKAYQERKQESMNHPLLDQNLRLAQLPFIQAVSWPGTCGATSRITSRWSPNRT